MGNDHDQSEKTESIEKDSDFTNDQCDSKGIMHSMN